MLLIDSLIIFFPKTKRNKKNFIRRQLLIDLFHGKYLTGPRLPYMVAAWYRLYEQLQRSTDQKRGKQKHI